MLLFKRVKNKLGDSILKEFLPVDELSQYLGIKKSSLYSLVEKREIPHYRIGRLVRFEKSEIDGWMDGHREECTDVSKEARKVLRVAAGPGRDIERVVKKAIDDAKGVVYTASNGKPDQVKGL